MSESGDWVPAIDDDAAAENRLADGPATDAVALREVHPNSRDKNVNKGWRSNRGETPCRIIEQKPDHQWPVL